MKTISKEKMEIILYGFVQQATLCEKLNNVGMCMDDYWASPLDLAKLFNIPIDDLGQKDHDIIRDVASNIIVCGNYGDMTSKASILFERFTTLAEKYYNNINLKN